MIYEIKQFVPGPTLELDSMFCTEHMPTSHSSIGPCFIFPMFCSIFREQGSYELHTDKKFPCTFQEASHMSKY